MKISSLFVIFCIGLQFAYGEQSPGVVEGYVLDSRTGQPLEAANVVISTTGKGDATDKNGYFRIQQIIAGDYEIEVELIGYKPYKKRIQLESGKTLKVRFKLEHQVLQGQEVTAEGERVDDIRLEISRPTFKLKRKDVREMAGGLEDVMRMIVNLPGVQSTSDFSNQFIVRGGGPDQNLILLDDVEIFNPYRNSGMPSLINPDIISDINLYAGGYPALYGDRLSSVLTLYTREGSSQKWLGGKLGFNLTTANFLLEGKTPFRNGAWLVSSRRTYNQLFAEDFADRLTLNNVAFPDFEDWHFKISLHPTPKHRLQAYSLVGRNDQDFLIKEELGEQDSERDSFDGGDTIKSTIVGASWNYVPSTNFQIKLYGNWYQNRGNSDFAGDFAPGPERSALQLCPIIDEECEIPPVFDQGDSTFLFAHQQQFRFRKLSFGGWLVQNKGNHILESGFGVDLQKNSVTSELDLSEFGQVVFDALQGAPNWFGALADSADQRDSYEKFYFYAQDKWSLANNRLTLQPGLRFDYYQLIHRAYVSPRFRLAYQLDSVTEIGGALGLYWQSPGFEKLLDGGEVFDLLKFDDFRGLSAERAIHSVLGVKRWLDDRLYLSIEGYHKKFDRLIDQAFETVIRPVAVYNLGQPAFAINYTVQDQAFFERVPRPINDISGTAYGVDFRLEKQAVYPSDRLTGWLSYSLGKSTREQNFAGEQVSYPYDFDRRHSVNVVLNYRLGRKWNFAVTWRFGSGFPFTPAQRVEALVAKVAPDPDNPEMLRNTILTDPETGYARFIPDFGGPENINSDRYPDYHRLDARLTFSTAVFHSNWQFYLDFVNLYDRNNVLFYRNIIKIEGVSGNLPPSLQFAKPVLFREPVYMYPFIPSLGLSVAF